LVRKRGTCLGNDREGVLDVGEGHIGKRELSGSNERRRKMLLSPKRSKFNETEEQVQGGGSLCRAGRKKVTVIASGGREERVFTK